MTTNLNDKIHVKEVRTMKDDYYKTVGAFFKMKRLEKGVSINDVAIAVNHGKIWYYDVETGKNRIFLKDTILLCKYFNCNLNELQEYIEKNGL